MRELDDVNNFEFRMQYMNLHQIKFSTVLTENTQNAMLRSANTAWRLKIRFSTRKTQINLLGFMLLEFHVAMNDEDFWTTAKFDIISNARTSSQCRMNLECPTAMKSKRERNFELSDFAYFFNLSNFSEFHSKVTNFDVRTGRSSRQPRLFS